MDISYNWLKNYIDIDDNIENLSKALTQIGLEVGSVHEFSPIEGGLEGFVIGKVLTCEKHPDADKLSVTTVDVGLENPLNIVCGAPNVAAGQKVVVATVGTIIYAGDEPFKIKKSKIRGAVSEGMICAEDELCIGNSHDGILVLPEDTQVGIKANEYFNIEKDIVLEVDLTPNRVDAASHIGVARDLAAFKNIKYKLPEINETFVSTNSFKVDIEVENSEACPRYMGVCMDNVTVCESPDWLKNRLKAIGLNPINNIVDISNFVLHETGFPLHTFDGDKIIGNKVIIKTVAKDSEFTTLDEQVRKLSDSDLMICNESAPMCIAGVFGGLESGIKSTTKKIFIESAYFNPTWIRRTAKRHTLSTDASFRYERGVDVNMAPYALKRVANLIQDLGYGVISSDIIDIYPNKIEAKIVDFSYNRCCKLIGKEIPKNEINKILNSLEYKIISEDNDSVKIEVPTYRVDVYREADIVEDILRIYGYNNIEIPQKISISIGTGEKPDNEKLVNTTANMLAANGFNEIMCNSLISNNLFDENDNTKVKIYNPLSNDLGTMRPSMIYGGLDSIKYNINRKRSDIKFFEFGKTYHANPENANTADVKRYSEYRNLAIWVSGNKTLVSWNLKETPSDYFFLKSTVSNIFNKLGLSLEDFDFTIENTDMFEVAQIFKNKQSQTIASIGIVNQKLLKDSDISQSVYYAEINWELVLQSVKNLNFTYKPVSKFPSVKRDLSLLIDKQVNYKQLSDIAYKQFGALLKSISLFDVYEGKNIEEGKISYALSYVLQDPAKTMTDKQIDKLMSKLIQIYETDLNAKVRQ